MVNHEFFYYAATMRDFYTIFTGNGWRLPAVT
jgi:hypothetical protein